MSKHKLHSAKRMLAMLVAVMMVAALLPTVTLAATAQDFVSALEAHLAAKKTGDFNEYGVYTDGSISNLHRWTDVSNNKTYVYYVGDSAPSAPTISSITGSGSDGVYTYSLDQSSTYTVQFDAVALYNIEFENSATGTIHITDGSDSGLDVTASRYVIGHANDGTYASNDSAITVKDGEIEVSIDPQVSDISSFKAESKVYTVTVGKKSEPTASVVEGISSDIDLSNQAIWPSGTWGDMSDILKDDAAAPTYVKQGATNTWAASGTLKKVTGWTEFNVSEPDEQSGYYAGVFIPVPSGVDTSGFKGKLGSKELPPEAIEGSGDKKGLYFIIMVAGADATSTTKQFAIEIDWDGDGKEYSNTAVTIDFSGVTLDNGEEPSETADLATAKVDGVLTTNKLTDSDPWVWEPQTLYGYTDNGSNLPGATGDLQAASDIPIYEYYIAGELENIELTFTDDISEVNKYAGNIAEPQNNFGSGEKVTAGVSGKVLTLATSGNRDAYVVQIDDEFVIVRLVQISYNEMPVISGAAVGEGVTFTFANDIQASRNGVWDGSAVKVSNIGAELTIAVTLDTSSKAVIKNGDDELETLTASGSHVIDPLEAGIYELSVTFGEGGGTEPGGLSGTAEIDNMSPKIGDTLTASLDGGNNTGELTYTWKYADNDAAIGTGETYVVKAADLGKTIKVEIESSVESGTVTSGATSAVVKKDYDGVVGTPVALSQTTESVTLTPVAGYEYASVASGTSPQAGDWKTSPVFEALTGGSTYDFYQRVAETSDTNASGASEKLSITMGKITYDVIANGSSGQVTTTALILTFSEAPDLNTSGVTEISTSTGFNPVSLTKNNDTTYTLEIDTITVANGADVTVAITKSGVDDTAKDVAVNVAPKKVTWSSLAADGTPSSVTTTTLTLTFGEGVKLTSGDFTVIGADIASVSPNGQSDATSYTLTVENFTVADGETVTVSVDNEDYDFTPSTKNVAVNVAPTAITWSKLEAADGSQGSETTTKLTLTFDKEVPLTLADITVTGATKMELTSADSIVYTLTIGSITVGDNQDVTIAVANPKGYTISGSSKTVKVFVDSDLSNGFDLTLKSTPPVDITPGQTMTFEYEIETMEDEMIGVTLDLIYDKTQLTIDDSSITTSTLEPNWEFKKSDKAHGYQLGIDSGLQGQPLQKNTKVTVTIPFTAADPLEGETVVLGAIVAGFDEGYDDFFGEGVETTMNVVEKKLVLTTQAVGDNYSIRTENGTNVGEDKYLFGLPEKKNAAFVEGLFDSAFASNCTIKIYNKNDVEVTGSANIGTGSTIKLVDDVTDYVWDSVKVVVKGDVTSTGTITLKDYSMVGRTYTTQSFLQDAYQLAARVTGKSTVLLKDYSMVGRHYVGTFDIFAQ